MRYTAFILIITLALGCKSKVEMKEASYGKATADSMIISEDRSNSTTFIKGDTLFIYDEKLSWEPFIQEKEDMEKIRKTYPEVKRQLNYNNNSEFNDTLITYDLNDNEVVIYASDEDKNIRQARLSKNGVLLFKQQIDIGMQMQDLLKKLNVSAERENPSTVVICPDEDELQELILKMDDANRIKEIVFYGYYD
jgi:hypothetical protein